MVKYLEIKSNIRCIRCFNFSSLGIVNLWASPIDVYVLHTQDKIYKHHNYKYDKLIIRDDYSDDFNFAHWRWNT